MGFARTGLDIDESAAEYAVQLSTHGSDCPADGLAPSLFAQKKDGCFGRMDRDTTKFLGQRARRSFSGNTATRLLLCNLLNHCSARSAVPMPCMAIRWVSSFPKFLKQFSRDRFSIAQDALRMTLAQGGRLPATRHGSRSHEDREAHGADHRGEVLRQAHA